MSDPNGNRQLGEATIPAYKARVVHLQVSLATVPVWWRAKLLLGGTLHLLVRRHGDGLRKISVDGVKCTLDKGPA